MSGTGGGGRGEVGRGPSRGGALADDDVEPEVFERRVEDLLDRAVQAMDLVDEQHVVLLEAREDRRHVPFALERRPGDAADADPELLANDVRKARLAEARRPDDEDVVERFRT